MCLLASKTFGMKIIPWQSSNETHYIQAPRLDYLGPWGRDYNANPVRGVLFTTEERHPSENLKGKVLIYALKSGESQEEVAKRLKDRGLVALVTVLRAFTDVPGNGNWNRDRTRPNQPFPIYEITAKANKSLAGWYTNQSSYGGVLVELDDEKNPWDKTFLIGVPIIAYYMLLHNGVIAVTAAYKWTLTIHRQGGKIELSIPQSVFALNLIGSILRIIFAAGDPFGAWETTNFLFTQLMFSISLPVTICSVLLIALYWHETIQRTSGNKPLPFLKKLKIPFLVFILAVQIWEIIVSTLRGLYISLIVLVFIDGAIYVLTVLSIVIFFIVTRIRLQRVFDKVNQQLNSEKSQKLSLATYHFVGIVICMFIWVIILILGASSVIWTPVGFPIAWFIFFLMLNLVAHFQVLMIRAPQRPWKWILCGACMSDPGSLVPPDDSKNNTFQSTRGNTTARNTIDR